LLALGVRADVDVHAHGVGPEPHSLFDVAHQYLRVDVGGMHGPGRQVHDHRARAAQLGGDGAASSLVDDDGVGSARHVAAAQTARQAESVEFGGRTVAGVAVTVVAVDRIATPHWFRLDDADAIVFGAATYMGTASAAFHSFAEASSKRWFTERWTDKLAAGFT